MPVPERQSAAAEAPVRDLFGPVARDLPRVQRRMRELTRSNLPALEERFAVLMDRPGKMIRSGLLLLTAKAAGAGRLNRTQIEYAAVVELIHMATLLHDDVIDRASLRRGQPSANTLWGNAAAVLLGDYLLSSAFTAGIKTGVADANELLTETAGHICRGELMQNLQSGNWRLTESEYFEIIDGKTGALFACAAALGALLAEASPRTIKQARQFGFWFGRAFQVSDDLQDLTGSRRSLGKDARADLKHSKPTLPIIHWLSSLGPRKQSQAVKRLTAEPAGRWVLPELQAAGSLDYTRRVLADCGDRAARSLADLPENTAKSALIRLNSSLKNRR